MKDQSWQRSFVAILLQYRLPILFLIIVLSLFFFSPFVKNPQVLFQRSDNKISIEDDSGRELIAMAERFGQGEPLLLVIEAENVLSNEILALVKRLTSTIEGIEGVKKVESLATVKDVSINSFGEIELQRLVGGLPCTPSQLEQIKEAVFANPMWAETLLSVDGTATVINITLPPLTRGSLTGVTVVNAVNELLEMESIPPQVSTYITGLTPLLEDSAKAVEADFKRFFWLTWLVMVALLFFAFKTVRGVLLPLSITMLTVGWTLGIMALAGETMSSVGAMLPSMIAIVCFSDAVHVLTHYYEYVNGKSSRTEIIIQTMKNMLTACFLTSLTTAAAFFTLTVSELSNIRQLGLWSAFGIMLGYVLISVLLPLLLSFLPVPTADVVGKYQKSLFTRFITFSVLINRKHGGKIAVLCVLLFILALQGIGRIKEETGMTAFLPEKAPAIQGLTILQEKLLGFGTVEMEIRGSAGVFEEPWALREIEKIEHFLEARDDVGTVTSVVDFFQWMYSKFEQSEENFLNSDHASGLISEFLFMIESVGQYDQFSALLADANSIARLSARLKIAGTGEQVQLLDDLETFIRENVDKRLQVVVSGDAARMSEQINSILRSLTNSFFITLIIILFLMLWLLRSFKGAAIAMVPNIFPVVLTMGVMGVLGLSLNFATAMISSIAIGISVDNTIHLLVRYRRELKGGGFSNTALENTLKSTGRALIFTSVVMSSGCALFTLSDFSPIKSLGGLMVFTLLVALVMDMYVLPWMIRSVRLRI